MEWLERTAMGRQSAFRIDHSDRQEGSRGGATEGVTGTDGGGHGEDDADRPADEGISGYDDEDTPLTWAEVISVCTVPSRTSKSIIRRIQRAQ